MTTKSEWTIPYVPVKRSVSGANKLNVLKLTFGGGYSLRGERIGGNVISVQLDSTREISGKLDEPHAISSQGLSS